MKSLFLVFVLFLVVGFWLFMVGRLDNNVPLVVDEVRQELVILGGDKLKAGQTMSKSEWEYDYQIIISSVISQTGYFVVEE